MTHTMPTTNAPTVHDSYRPCPRCIELEAFPEFTGDRSHLPSLPTNRHVLRYVQCILSAPGIQSWTRICAIRSVVARGVDEMEGKTYADAVAAGCPCGGSAAALAPAAEGVAVNPCGCGDYTCETCRAFGV